MRNDDDEHADREAEAEYWRNYTGGGRCGLLSLAMVVLIAVAAWAA